MRQIQLRTLAAQGITVQKPIKIVGLVAHQAQDECGNRLIVFSGALLGTSWVGVGHILELHNTEFKIIALGRPYFVAPDSNQLRGVLEVVASASKRSRREEVFIKDMGFLVSELRRSFDARALIAPALLLLLTLGLAANQYFDSAPLEEPKPETKNFSCALDMGELDFRAWLKGKISNREASPAKTSEIKTDLGEITLVIEQAIGATQFVTGALSCEDGRSKKFQFRTDSQPGRGLVDLGSSLDP